MYTPFSTFNWTWPDHVNQSRKVAQVSSLLIYKQKFTVIKSVLQLAQILFSSRYSSNRHKNILETERFSRFVSDNFDFRRRKLFFETQNWRSKVLIQNVIRLWINWFENQANKATGTPMRSTNGFKSKTERRLIKWKKWNKIAMKSMKISIPNNLVSIINVLFEHLI